MSICVAQSIPLSQQPYPGCEWYQPHTFSLRPASCDFVLNSTMYSYASACALTRVSVPSTGSAYASITMNVGPRGSDGSILPCISPITSSEPPDRACITIFTSAIAEIRTCLKYFGSSFHGRPESTRCCSALSYW